jgi:hypothetical protein
MGGAHLGIGNSYEYLLEIASQIPVRLDPGITGFPGSENQERPGRIQLPIMKPKSLAEAISRSNRTCVELLVIGAKAAGGPIQKEITNSGLR